MEDTQMKIEDYIRIYLVVGFSAIILAMYDYPHLERPFSAMFVFSIWVIGFSRMGFFSLIRSKIRDG
jgi:hypothetical protein